MMQILSLRLAVTPASALSLDALTIGLEIGHPTYDCDYLVLAMREGVRVVTADTRLYRAATSYPKYAPYVRWIDPATAPQP